MNKELSTKNNIAILGGGTSGLAAAYYLLNHLKNKSEHYDIHLFEKNNHLGGNVHTVIVKLGESFSSKSEKDDLYEYKNLVRWADMGVNDINLSEYTTLKDVMLNTGYLNTETINGPFNGTTANESNMKPIEDGACFFSFNNQWLYTDDDNLPLSRPLDRRFSLEKLNPSGQLESTKIGCIFNTIVDYGSHLTETQLEDAWNLSLSAFFEQLILAAAKQPHLFSEQSTQLAPNDLVLNLLKKLEDKSELSGETLATAITEVRDNLFLPRVAAMFFTSDIGPAQLPVAAPFGYFKYQEGGGKAGKPDRRYFYGGARTWIEHLETYLRTQYEQADNLSLHIHLDVEANLEAIEGGFLLKGTTNPEIPSFYQGVISTILASQVRQNLQFSAQYAEQGNQLAPIVGRIKYTQSIGIVHTDASVMASDTNSWRTFNVSIRHGETMLPYSITFQENRHQNDWQNSHIKHAPELSYFITLNPTQPIDDKFVLRTVDTSTLNVRSEQDLEFICGTSFEHLPQATQRHFKRETSKNLLGRDDQKAIYYFNHNVYDKDAHLSQKEISAYHTNLPENVLKGYVPITFAGSWCAEVGLQETCWRQAKVAAETLIQSLSARK
ncbi:NAD(P)-binding protein [Photobacterium galatheae]|uniref:Amine oxidase domain-containing protein n=1 Tax=Photobacterium galatheae TaxID=1654360 RepID=A0A066RIV7_9GAMM|nr:NAD(P)-binding protein [Photobacterium galatheae]KDM90380.1 hypothetical protein EA58_16755 [Photobacterium galatheae]MCM0147901.1 NAD(P)-binding protein [Photobacterium galatheae]